MSNNTSANIVLTLSSADMALAATVIEGFSPDAAYSMDEIESVVATMGVDGKAYFGWVPRLTTFTVNLAAPSPSVTVMDTILTTMDTLRKPVVLNAVLQIPATGKSYTLAKGALTKVKVAPDGGRTLGNQNYSFAFERCRPAVI